MIRPRRLDWLAVFGGVLLGLGVAGCLNGLWYAGLLVLGCGLLVLWEARRATTDV